MKKRENRAPFRVRIERERYSESSRRSVGWEFLGGDYSDIEYHCRKCGAKAVFSAIEQKRSFENRKEYMHRRRVLCQTCWREGRSVKARLMALERRYCGEKAACLSDRAFLSEWLGLLKQQIGYTRRPNHMRIRFVEKHLAAA